METGVSERHSFPFQEVPPYGGGSLLKNGPDQTETTLSGGGSPKHVHEGQQISQE